jgi:hypothetical protein
MVVGNLESGSGPGGRRFKSSLRTNCFNHLQSRWSAQMGLAERSTSKNCKNIDPPDTASASTSTKSPTIETCQFQMGETAKLGRPLLHGNHGQIDKTGCIGCVVHALNVDTEVALSEAGPSTKSATAIRRTKQKLTRGGYQHGTLLFRKTGQSPVPFLHS